MKTDNQLRYAAKKQGFILRKSRKPISLDNQGGYMVINAEYNRIECEERFDMFEEDVEKFLFEEKTPKSK